MNKNEENVEIAIVMLAILAGVIWLGRIIINAFAMGNFMVAFGLIVLAAVVGITVLGIDGEREEVHHG